MLETIPDFDFDFDCTVNLNMTRNPVPTAQYKRALLGLIKNFFSRGDGIRFWTKAGLWCSQRVTLRGERNKQTLRASVNVMHIAGKVK
jgi:hypothetical protein